jgi:hypothetical protein
MEVQDPLTVSLGGPPCLPRKMGRSLPQRGRLIGLSRVDAPAHDLHRPHLPRPRARCLLGVPYPGDLGAVTQGDNFV